MCVCVCNLWTYHNVCVECFIYVFALHPYHHNPKIFIHFNRYRPGTVSQDEGYCKLQ